MKKLIALFLIFQILAGPVLAATDPPAAGMPYEQARLSRDKRIAIVWCSRWDVLNQGNVQSLKRNMFANIGNDFDAFEKQGGEVHEYNTAFFESDKDHREMWTDIGSKYALIFVMCPSSSAASFSRYICADSTNGHIVIVGGGSVGWQADSTVRGFVDSKPAAYEAVSSPTGNNAHLLTLNPALACTSFASRIPSGRRITTLASGESLVVRLAQPNTTGSTFIQDADSVNSNMPGVVSGFPNDSIAAKNDYLGPMWKVVFKNRSGENNPNATWINNLGIANSPRDVYWIKFTDGVIPSRTAPHYIWAMMCRFTTVNPISYFYDWDDITDKFANNLTGTRMSNATSDSMIHVLHDRYGIDVAGSVNPEHAVSYIRGTNPTYEVAWSGPAHTYIKDNSLEFVHHAHDSSAAGPSSNILGRYGGYSGGNAANATQGGSIIQIYQHRYASRRNPGANEGGFIGAGGNFGIVQRYDYADSLRRVVCPNCPIPPYETFPSNQMLPLAFRIRPCTNNPLWTYYKTIAVECPIDSMLWAMDTMLVQRTPGRGKLYLRGAFDDGTGSSLQPGTPFWGDASIRNTFLDSDRDSFVAFNLFAFPNEKWTTRVNGRLIQAVAVGGFLQGYSPRSQYMADANGRTAKILGLLNPLQWGENSKAIQGEAFSNDFQGVIAVGSTCSRDFNFSQSNRGIYQHPGQLGNGTPMYDVDCFLRSIGETLRFIDAIAGRPCSKNKKAWQVWGK